MHASVTYPYRDRDTFEIHYTGDSVELTADRFAELEAAGFVEAAEEPISEEPEEKTEAEPEEPTDAAPEELNPADMTVSELHAAIEAAGGFAPKKATKAELVKLFEAL
nr:MAG TPA: Thymopoietin protein [Caudoviricetes sp.]